MEAELLTLFNKMLAEQGPLAAMFAVLFWFLLKKTAIHSEERREWRTTIERQHEEILTIAKETNNVLSCLRTLVEHRKA
jgi:hypothetical protein